MANKFLGSASRDKTLVFTLLSVFQLKQEIRPITYKLYLDRVYGKPRVKQRQKMEESSYCDLISNYFLFLIDNMLLTGQQLFPVGSVYSVRVRSLNGEFFTF